MTINADSATRNDYVGNGVTTAFVTTFPILTATEVSVYLDGVLQSAGFTVSGVGQLAGGTITFSSAPSNGVKILLLPNVSNGQEVDYIELGKFPAESHERGLDRAAMRDLQLREVDSRALKFPLEDSGVTAELPAAADRANKYCAFDSGGNVIAASSIDTSALSISAFGESLIAALNAAAGRSVLGVPFTPASSSSSAYLDFAEDTDNGTNRMRFQAPASLAADVDVVGPSASGTLATLAGTETLSSKTVQTVASTTGGAGLNVPHGVAPSVPVNGDFWSTTAGAFMQINSSTKQLLTEAVPVTATPAALSSTVANIDVDFTTYSEYEIIVTLGACNGNIVMVGSSNGGGVYATTTYRGTKIANTTTSTITNSILTPSSSAVDSVLKIVIQQPSTSAGAYAICSAVSTDGGGNGLMQNTMALIGVSAAINRVQLSTGTSWAGYYTVKPIAKR